MLKVRDNNKLYCYECGKDLLNGDFLKDKDYGTLCCDCYNVVTSDGVLYSEYTIFDIDKLDVI